MEPAHGRLDGAGREPTAIAASVLSLTGLTATIPAGWVRDTIQPGPLAAKAAFRIPAGEGPDDAMVRITHYPNMKGMDEANIQRWLGQVARPDGSPATRDDAKITVEQAGLVQLTIVDLSGAVRPTMGAQPKADQRMIAAIVDHPQGPHFVVISGGVSLIAQHEQAIYGFLRSARAG